MAKIAKMLIGREFQGFLSLVPNRSFLNKTELIEVPLSLFLAFLIRCNDGVLLPGLFMTQYTITLNFNLGVDFSHFMKITDCILRETAVR